MLRIVMVSALLLASTYTFAQTSKCHGVYETTGEAVIYKTTTNVSLNANWKWEYEEGSNTAHCEGIYNRKEYGMHYYDVTRSKACPIDYVRFHRGFKNGKGLVSLVSRVGGDTHDHSGYTYAYFYCS